MASERREVWPEDEEFRKFAAKVADAVMAGEQSGVRISPLTSDWSCNCPLGVAAGVRYPSPKQASFRLGIPDSWAMGFVHAFEGQGHLAWYHNEACFRLGAAYRRWALNRNTVSTEHGGGTQAEETVR